MVRLPWQIKILAKLVLSRLPIPYRFWKRLGLFDAGQMDKPGYAHEVFSLHFERVQFAAKKGGFVVLELGPGDSLATGVIAHAYGAKQTFLVDEKPLAQQDMAVYVRLQAFLKDRGLPTADLAGATSMEDLKAICDITYFTNGVESLRQIPNQSVDFVFSQVVLSMVRLHELEAMLREVRRILRPDGVCSHRLDLTDLLARSLNHLRFSRKVWESPVMANSGFYSNRLRYSQYLKLFERAGFEVELVQAERWDSLPIPRHKLHPEFRELDEAELRVFQMDVVLRPKVPEADWVETAGADIPRLDKPNLGALGLLYPVAEHASKLGHISLVCLNHAL